MSAAKHTPGPWFVDPKNHFDVQAEGTEIASALCEYQEGDRWLIQGPITVSPETCAANARMIAAAPELLEALQDFMLAAACKNAKASQFRARFAQAERKARAAIAKATGAAS